MYLNSTYLVVPAINTDTCQKEINHLQTWAAENNLRLNRDKTKPQIKRDRLHIKLKANAAAAMSGY